MEYKDLSKKSVTELQKMLAEERGRLFDLRLKVSVNQLRNLREIRVTRRGIAKLLTALSVLNRATAEETK